MSNITNYLNKVKTAIYGKEVRGAIHDAIKQVYDDASVEHDNANMEVKLARGTHNTLNDRLDNVDEIQAQTNAQLSQLVINVKDFGAKGDGITDDRVAIQLAIDSSKNVDKNTIVYFPAGVYKIDATANNEKGLQLKSDITYLFHSKSELHAITTDSTHYSILMLDTCENITIDGATLIGERGTHTGTTGEWGMGIELLDCKNITITNCTINDMWGDGIHITNSYKDLAKCENIVIDNVSFNNNRRQGISVLTAENVLIKNSRFTNTGGTAPGYGIDIEPDHGGLKAKNIVIDNCYFSNNDGGGVVFGGGNGCEKITITKCEFHGDNINNTSSSTKNVIIRDNIIQNSNIVSEAGFSIDIINNKIYCDNPSNEIAAIGISANASSTHSNASINIDSNTVQGCWKGVLITPSFKNSKITLRRNSFVNLIGNYGSNGIQFYDTDGSGNIVDITNNIFNNIAGDCIAIGSDNTNISGNVFKESTQLAIYVAKNMVSMTIINNIFDDISTKRTHPLIEVVGGTTNVFVLNNKIKSPNAVSVFKNSYAGAIGGNVILNNVIIGGSNHFSQLNSGDINQNNQVVGTIG